MESFKKAQNKTEWVKIGYIARVKCVGPNAVIFGNRGCHLGVYDLQHKKTFYYTADNKIDGEGICCFEGHFSTNVFCFAESCSNPAVYVIRYAYPSFTMINRLENGVIEGYTNIAFIGTSYVVALGALPNFTINVWNFRTGDKVITGKGKHNISKQILRTNSEGNATLTQLEEGTCKFTLWEILLSGKRGSMIPVHIDVSNSWDVSFTQNIFTLDNNLYFVDITGSIYFVDVISHKSFKEIDFNEEGDLIPQINIYETSGIMVSGPNHQIRHYNKVDGQWAQIWTWEMTTTIRYILCNAQFQIFGVTDKSEIVSIDPKETEVTYITMNASCFNDFCLVYPVGEYVVALANNQHLYVYAVKTGKLVSMLTLKAKTLAIAGNTEFPYVGIGDKTGCLKLYSIYEPEKIKHIVTFNLTKNALNSVYFSEFGRVIVAANTEIGEFFIIEGVPGTHMKILATINARKQIADYMLAASETCLRVFMIPVTEKDILAGSKLIRYCIQRQSISVKDYEIDTEDTIYYKLQATSSSTRDRIFYALSLKDKNIHQLETKRGDEKARIIAKFPTGHQLKKFGMYKDKYHIITWSYDGLIIVRDSKLDDFIGLAAPHHRMDFGVRRAHVDPLGKYIVSLGRDNILTCTNLLQRKVSAAEKETLANIMKCSQFKVMFTERTYGFVGAGKYEHKTWLEYEHITKVEKEKTICFIQRNLILEEFKAIAEALSKIITDNLNGPENEKLNMLEFNLDKKLYDKKIKENKIKCDETEQYLKKLIAAQNKVRDFLKKNFWDIVEDQSLSIHALFQRFHVANYPRFPTDSNNKQLIDITLKRVKYERFLANEYRIFPWKNNALNRPSNIKHPLVADLAALLSETSVTELQPTSSRADGDSIENLCAYSGSISCMFIAPSPLKINQRKLQFALQYQFLSALLLEEINELRILFNKKFNSVYQQKIRELHVMKEKTNRLRHIVSEINYFSPPEGKINVEINDVDWREDEMTQNIITVAPNEITIAPYISPSQQAILDAKAAEEERIRLLLLADDFRERALMTMMNGVLEVRWEDELKKDVPIPKCMIEKIPEQYNEEDIVLAKDYEEKVKILQKERIRYKIMLTAEYSKVRTAILDSNKKFNERLEDLLVQKLKIQTAIDQECLIMNRQQLKLLSKNKFHEEMRNLEKSMQLNAESIEKVNEIITVVNQVYAEIKGNYDTNVTAKEKHYEKSFRRDIMEYTTVAQEQAMKLYKKRPKASLKTINSKTLLLELAKCVVSKEYSVSLSHDSVEYLKSLEQLDQYIGIPPIVDTFLYSLVCKHRRFRIELEIKCRVSQLYYNLCEVSLQHYSKLLECKKIARQNYVDEMQQCKEKYASLLQNFEVQYVIKSGLVEIPCNGDLEDMDDAILVRRQVILDINDKIRAAGEKKLKSMAQTMAFRRRILLKEWQHKKMRYHIQDLEMQIEDIVDVHVTREMKQIIKNKMNGIPDRSSYEAEIDLMKTSYEYTVRILNDSHAKYQKQIKELKKKTSELNVQIADTNVDICELNLQLDTDFTQKHQEVVDYRIAEIVKRKKLVQAVQKNHNEILVLQTELELLRLKTFPTLKYKIFS